MGTKSEGSITRYLTNLRAGDDVAARLLWERYFDGLVRLARERLGATPRAAADEEDVALSAFHSLCTGAARGHFARLGSRDELWRLLVTITVRKALDQMRCQRRLKRGGGQVLGEAALVGEEADSRGGGMDQLEGNEPTPELVAILEEECRLRLAGLRDETLRRIARLRMEGYTCKEIAERLGCNRRTVERKLDLIRQAWQ